MKLLLRSSFILGFTLLVTLTGLQHLPDILDKFFAHPGRLTEFPKKVYSLQLDQLAPGEYYLSLGRPRHFCDINYNQELIFKGKTSINDKRPSLLVGAGFSHLGGPAKLTADCRQYMSGFAPRLSFPPRLFSYELGIAIHGLRNFIDMGAGPIACLFLIAAAFLNYFFSRGTEDKKRTYVFIGFSVVALAYSLSLAHYTRLIMSGMTASQWHIVLRTAFSLGMAALLHPRLFPGIFLTGLHLALCIAVFALPLFNIDIELYYRVIFAIYPITTFYTLWASRKVDDGTYDSFFLQALLLSWGAAQAMDWVKQLSGIGYFAAPLYMWAIASYLTYRVAKQQSRLLQASSLAKTLESFIQSTLKPSELVKEVGLILQGQSCYNTCSIYLLQSFVGTPDANGKDLVLVGTVGKSSSPSTIILDAIESPKLVEAMSDQTVLEGIGERDNRRYMILPLGRFGAICFTTTEKIPLHVAGETKKLFNLLTPSLQLLNEKLSRLVSLTGSSLSKLRSTYGDGTYPKTIGAIFIDIADYSKRAEEYGESYTSFVSSSLLPGFIKNLKDIALPEVVRGDEILFIVCDESPSSKKNIYDDTAIAVQKLSAYMQSEAQSLSKEEGFGKVEFRVGFTVGEGTIVIDDVQARTSGGHINKAKRLQDTASKGDFFTDSETMSQMNNLRILPLSKTQIVVKKNIIEAVKVGVKRAA
jgi:hypothetical protein